MQFCVLSILKKATDDLLSSYYKTY